MNDKNWEELKAAYDYIAHPGNNINKLENPKWIIYKCGANIIRIDIRVNK